MSLRPKVPRTLAAIGALVFTVGPAGAEPRVARYEGRISLLPGGSAKVALEVVYEGLEPARERVLAYRMVKFPDQAVMELRAGFPTKEGEWRISGSGRSLRLDLVVPPGAVSSDGRLQHSVSYQVRASGSLVRLPLPVPLSPTRPGDNAVNLNVRIDDGYIRSGTSFPAFTWRTIRDGESRLSNVPAFVKMATRPGLQLSLWDTLAEAANPGDVVVLILILSGTVVWLSRKSRSRGRSSGNG